MSISAARAVQAAVTSPPVTEQGSALSDGGASANSALYTAGLPSWSEFFRGDDLEFVPELKWKPGGKGLIEAYHKARSDSQIQGLYMGATYPIRRYGWFLEPNGAREEVVTMLSKDYNLPIRGQEDQPRGRRQGRFNFQEHLRHALLALIYGHMYFEQSGEFDPDMYWHLRKLGVRMPQSIMKFNLEKDGGLKSIEQRGLGVSRAGRRRSLSINRLVGYVWEREGANWAGRSLLRGIYRNYLLKEMVMKIGAINIERAGGVPVIAGPKGATPEDLAELGKMARAFRVGANAGGSIPHGAELTLARAAGGDEATNYVKMQNEEMARGWLMMFLNLGQAGSHGSYAMSDSFIDYTLNAQEVIAQWVCDVFTEFMIEDHVTWNWGLDEQIPLLVYKRTDDRQLAVSDMVSLIDKRVITVDDELEAWVREDYRMPRRNPELTPRTVPGDGGSPPSPGQSGTSGANDG
jgi:hypothetical protein